MMLIRLTAGRPGSRLAAKIMLEQVAAVQNGASPAFPDRFLHAFADTLARAPEDPAFGALTLLLPGEAELGLQMAVIDVGCRAPGAQRLAPETGRGIGPRMACHVPGAGRRR